MVSVVLWVEGCFMQHASIFFGQPFRAVVLWFAFMQLQQVPLIPRDTPSSCYYTCLWENNNNRTSIHFFSRSQDFGWREIECQCLCWPNSIDYRTWWTELFNPSSFGLDDLFKHADYGAVGSSAIISSPKFHCTHLPSWKSLLLDLCGAGVDCWWGIQRYSAGTLCFMLCTCASYYDTCERVTRVVKYRYIVVLYAVRWCNKGHTISNTMSLVLRSIVFCPRCWVPLRTSKTCQTSCGLQLVYVVCTNRSC